MAKKYLGAYLAASLLLFLARPSLSVASVYQWSTTIDSVISPESKGHPRAYLWVPDRCDRVRAVVIADQNMEEEQIFQDVEFRKTLAQLGFAEIWIAPSMGSINFRFDQDDPQVLQATLQSLADKSGYGEIASAPLVPMGHSATASWGWDMAAWNPQRVLAVLSISGQWPYFSSKYWGDRNVDQVPGLTTKGEYEIQGSLEHGWYAGIKGDLYQKHPYEPFTQVVEPGDGHFSASKEKIALIDLFLRKAAHYRMAAGPSADASHLKPIDAKTTGWLYDVWHLDAPPSAPAAPVLEYQGQKDHAFWAFDKEMAEAIERFQGQFRGQKNVLVGYVQKPGITSPTPDHAMVHLKFEPLEGGLTFKLRGDFWNAVPPTPDGKSSEWEGWLSEGKSQIAQGAPVSHPADETERMMIAPICGPVHQIAADTFQIRFNRVGFDNPKRANDIWLFLTYPGDGEYKKMVQQAELRIPLLNSQGTPQTIDFPKIPDQPAGGAKIKLGATSSAKVPVYYYVREGPAEVDDDGNISFTPLPPRSKFPIEVTVVAWQWGRSIDPKIQSAKPVERTFLILPPKVDATNVTEK
ncbi:MAG: hypothetical protein JO353_13240 [Phycisphaerae bacterium]|nr:hypothetical protein [Phycisphaerae bacterium]